MPNVFKKKYIKYKIKYLLLKSINKNITVQYGGGKKYFSTIKNSGMAFDNEGNSYSNQCFWISIIDYFNEHNIIEGTINIKTIREFVSKEYNGIINGVNEAFDNFLHGDALYFVAVGFDLTINIYYCKFEDHSRIPYIETTYCASYGTGTNIVNIVSYGFHFELIIDMYDAYDKDSIVDVPIFMPNVNLALGNNKEPIDVDNIMRTKLDKLIEENNRLSIEKLELKKKHTDKNNKKLLELLHNISTEKTMFVNKEFLEPSIKILENEIKKNEIQYKENMKNISNIVNIKKNIMICYSLNDK